MNKRIPVIFLVSAILLAVFTAFPAETLAQEDPVSASRAVGTEDKAPAAASATEAAPKAIAAEPVAGKVEAAVEDAGHDRTTLGTNNMIGLWIMWALAPIGSLAALFVAFRLYKWMIRADQGNETMRRIAGNVTKGARAYLRRQYTVVLIFVVLLSGCLWLMARAGMQHYLVPFAFLTGAFFSGLCGWIGMGTATKASNRTAQGASESLNRGLQVAFRAGGVMGLVVVGLGLFDICLWFAIMKWVLHADLHTITVVMLCFGMGASSQALFARVGGGIFTKAADVGADLVGKVEAGIPEDDPRNPATIADNVGDNVGDVAGMGADLYESYCGSILATAALGVSAGLGFKGIVLPLLIASVGIMLSICGIYAVRTKEDATPKQLMKALNLGVNLVAGVGIFVFSFFAVLLVMTVFGGLTFTTSLGLWLSIVAGLLAGIVIGKATEYYTSYDFKPTRRVAEQGQTGPATVIISGMGVGMISTWIPVVCIGAAIVTAFGCANGFTNPAMGLFGVGIAAVGMLSTLGITLATDAYGPIADNAGGNAEMSELGAAVRKRTDALDSLGNTTAATGKGFAIGSAALTAMALIAAYIEEVRIGLQRLADKAVAGAQGVVHILTTKFGTVTATAVQKADGVKASVMVNLPGQAPVSLQDATIGQFMQLYLVHLMNPNVLVGLFIGAMLAFVFCAMTMNAVGRAAGKMVQEVRRQFREIAGIMEGKADPDYARCVSISTAAAQKEMIVPSLMAIIVPVAVGVLLGVEGVIGLLAGGLATGFVLAIMMANAGGSWDNAKKYIEAGALGGKGSDAHKACVTGDTVGDPFKDTSGPSLNILIKLMAMVSVVFAGLTVSVNPHVKGFVTELFNWFGKKAAE